MAKTHSTRDLEASELRTLSLPQLLLRCDREVEETWRLLKRFDRCLATLDHDRA
jgi:hypothetical protein